MKCLSEVLFSQSLLIHFEQLLMWPLLQYVLGKYYIYIFAIKAAKFLWIGYDYSCLQLFNLETSRILVTYPSFTFLWKQSSLPQMCNERGEGERERRKRGVRKEGKEGRDRRKGRRKEGGKEGRDRGRDEGYAFICTFVCVTSYELATVYIHQVPIESSCTLSPGWAKVKGWCRGCLA